MYCPVLLYYPKTLSLRACQHFNAFDVLLYHWYLPNKIYSLIQNSNTLMQQLIQVSLFFFQNVMSFVVDNCVCQRCREIMHEEVYCLTTWMPLTVMQAYKADASQTVRLAECTRWKLFPFSTSYTRSQLVVLKQCFFKKKKQLYNLTV